MAVDRFFVDTYRVVTHRNVFHINVPHEYSDDSVLKLIRRQSGITCSGQHRFRYWIGGFSYAADGQSLHATRVDVGRRVLQPCPVLPSSSEWQGWGAAA